MRGRVKVRGLLPWNSGSRPFRRLQNGHGLLRLRFGRNSRSRRSQRVRIMTRIYFFDPTMESTPMAMQAMPARM